MVTFGEVGGAPIKRLQCPAKSFANEIPSEKLSPTKSGEASQSLTLGCVHESDLNSAKV